MDRNAMISADQYKSLKEGFNPYKVAPLIPIHEKINYKTRLPEGWPVYSQAYFGYWWNYCNFLIRDYKIHNPTYGS